MCVLTCIMYVSVYVLYMCVCVWIYIYTYIYIYVCVCVFACVCVCVSLFPFCFLPVILFLFTLFVNEGPFNCQDGVVPQTTLPQAFYCLIGCLCLQSIHNCTPTTMDYRQHR